MPWDPKYRKPSVQGIVANAIDVVVETGDSGPVTPIGINLPNDQAIREKYGSKSVALSNVTEAYEPRRRRDRCAASSPGTPEEAERAAKFADLAGELTTDMHEVIGHASGRSRRRLKGTPQAAASRSSSRRSKKAAPIWSASTSSPIRSWSSSASSRPPIRTTIVRAEYEAYTRNALVQLRRIREGTQIEEDHMRNRQMIVRWLMANTKAIEERTRDGKTYLVMVDPKAFRDGVRPAAGRGAADQGGGRLRRREEAVRHLRRPLRSEAARRGRRARRQAEPAVLLRLRDAEAHAGARSATGRSPT